MKDFWQLDHPLASLVSEILLSAGQALSCSSQLPFKALVSSYLLFKALSQLLTLLQIDSLLSRLSSCVKVHV